MVRDVFSNPDLFTCFLTIMLIVYRIPILEMTGATSIDVTFSIASAYMSTEHRDDVL